MVSLDLVSFIVSEKETFKHFSDWSNVKLLPAMAAFLLFWIVVKED
jgi:hypothetical protein